MLLHKTQDKIAIDTHRFRVLCCGRRWGKTTLAVEEIKGKALAKPCRIAYIAPTIQQARDIAWEMIKKELKPITIKARESPSLDISVHTLNGGHSDIILRGWESVETLRGQSFDFLIIDEIAMMRNFWVNWNEVLRPTLTDRKGEAMFISTPKGFNHFYDLYNFESKDNDFKSFHFTSYDNPHIPKEEIDKAAKEIPLDQFHQEYMADFRKMQGLVYKDFDRGKHIFTDFETNNWKDRLCGLDFGFTNPTAMYLVLKDYDSHYWITSEFYKREKTTPEIIEYAKSLRATKYYPDPAEPDRIEEMKRAGLNTQDVSKDVEAGISAVQQLLRTNRLHIHSSCVNLINEFETYRYAEKKPDKNDPESPIKENDHGLDAIRYCLYMQEGEHDTLTANSVSVFIPTY